MQPADRLGLLHTIRSGWGMTSGKDQQIGGLLMWVPLCMVYLGAIFAQIARWFAPSRGKPACAYPRRKNLMNRRTNTIPQSPSRTHPGWEPLPGMSGLAAPELFPGPAWPAMGTAFIFWSVITSWVIFFIGVGLFAASLAGWISEMRSHERKYHS